MSELKIAARKGGATQASAVYARLRQDVISTVIAPGEKLRVRDLCARYGVGLNPLREALNRATTDGFVCQSDLRGFFAAPVSAQDLIELTEARCLLAEVCLRTSIEKGDAAWEEGIVLASHRLSRVPPTAPGETDPSKFNPEWEAAHRAFHRSLIAACGSSWLLDIDSHLFDAADRYRHLSRKAAKIGSTERPDQHPSIMQAVLDRDTAAATAILQSHYQRTAEHGLKQLARMAAQA